LNVINSNSAVVQFRGDSAVTVLLNPDPPYNAIPVVLGVHPDFLDPTCLTTYEPSFDPPYSFTPPALPIVPEKRFRSDVKYTFKAFSFNNVTGERDLEGASASFSVVSEKAIRDAQPVKTVTTVK
jgi:hypothetical protein